MVAGMATSVTLATSVAATPAVGLKAADGPVFGPYTSVFEAERGARDLGPVPGNLELAVSLSLKVRDRPILNDILAHSRRVSPARWANFFGPAPAQVNMARRVLAREGVATSWRPGQVALEVTAPAVSVQRALGLSVHYFAGRNGTEFYAPLRAPAVPVDLRGTVTAVTGLTDYAELPTVVTNAIAGTEGITPAQIAAFYDMGPLRRAGLDGSGETVMFPETVVIPQSALNAFAAKFHLPAFHVTYLSDPAAWGAPAGRSSADYSLAAAEESLDLEVVHGLAPGATEVVYETNSLEPGLSNMFAAMIKQHPKGIISSSYNYDVCVEDPGYDGQAESQSAVFEAAAAVGTSVMQASGDRGAYECVYEGEPIIAGDLSVSAVDNSPYITDVGGTLVLFSATGAYYKEAAWGEPLDQWGGTGGFSTVFARPSWQQGPGLAGIDHRGVPDVSANADPNSGWAIFAPAANGHPAEEAVGGTSGAAPCWAAVVALIDEYLAQQHLPSVGFANPALYFFASHPKGLPAPAFHDITEGTNLYYPATLGWDAATGLGSPDVAHLADDFEWYYRTHQNGS